MKILLLSYYFPPCGGAAVQRWLRFSRALVKQGHSLTVITTEDGDYPYMDESLLAKLPPKLKVLRSRPLGFGRLWSILGQKHLPYGSLRTEKRDSFITKLLYWLRLNLIVPDLRIGWNPSAYKLAEKELKADRYDYVISTGPPHSTHLIGLKLKRRYGIQWRTDFRDPMSDIYYLKLSPPCALTRYAHKYLERKIIQFSDLNYIVSSSIARSLPQGHKAVLYNGFDPEDFAGLSYSRSDSFRIKFAGQLTAGQDPSPLLEALNCLKDASKVEFSLIGTRDFPASEFPLRKLPFLEHRKGLEEIVNAELLVLFINSYQGNEGMLTTKLFEYIASRTPILCFGNHGGEAAKLILGCQAGQICQTGTQAVDMINREYEAWLAGREHRCFGDISMLNVNNQVNRLCISLDSLLQTEQDS